MTSDYFAKHCSEVELLFPQLPPEPNLAIEEVQLLINQIGQENVLGLIGSSLGGYYSIYLKSILNPSIKIILINPAMRPFELLADYVGENTNYYTGEVYEVLPEHMTQLQSFHVSDPNIINSLDCDRCLLLTQTKDEVLDYSQATMTLKHAKMWVISGGDHSFQNYDQVLPEIVNFLKI